MAEASLHIFGVRHHGPGSARSLRRALDTLEPDIILLEGPPEADDVIPLAAHEQMKPPVALLVYVPDEPQKAVFYPFAVFSPEWQTLQYALRHKTPVRFMDLPQFHRLAADEGGAEKTAETEPDGNADGDGVARRIRSDPLGELAAAAGYSDGERWWDHMVESRRGGDVEVFNAVAEAMGAVREDLREDDANELRREAYMRNVIRAAMKEGFQRVAVVCGAWHAPALKDPDAPSLRTSDAAMLKGLPKVKTRVAWVPWSYHRLSFRSGYGAGVLSPEWYHLTWSQERHLSIQWTTRVARLMRDQDLDASSAHIIEAVRLADSLAALRGRSMPGLEELDEAALTVMCFGNDAPMRLIRRKLVIGDRLGHVPDDVPMAPLQADLAKQQKGLRLPASADEKDYDLDLRQPIDLERSHLLHRLNLLGLPWGEPLEARAKKGTFHEYWRLQWEPEYVVTLIEAGQWGNTIAAAATARTVYQAEAAPDLVTLTQLLQATLFADLPEAVSKLMLAIQQRTAVSGDVPQLMDALVPLAGVSRYGNVRKTDLDMVLDVVNGLVPRICIGLPNSCASLDDDAARAMFQRILSVDGTIGLLQNDQHTSAWRTVLGQLVDQHGVHGLVSGRSCRLLHDAGQSPPEETARRLNLALSRASDPIQAAAWAEGFLAGSGALLIHDETLWGVVDEWVNALTSDHFVEILPLLRRTFATFAAPERRQMGQRAARKAGVRGGMSAARDDHFDREAADAVLPLLAKLLGAEKAS